MSFLRDMSADPPRAKRRREVAEAIDDANTQSSNGEKQIDSKRIRTSNPEEDQQPENDSIEVVHHAPTRQRDCPYLGTINRHVLDFDFEKLCSVTLSNQRPYGCLVCGKFFQGIIP